MSGQRLPPTRSAYGWCQCEGPRGPEKGRKMSGARLQRRSPRRMVALAWPWQAAKPLGASLSCASLTLRLVVRNWMRWFGRIGCASMRGCSEAARQGFLELSTRPSPSPSSTTSTSNEALRGDAQRANPTMSPLQPCLACWVPDPWLH